MLESLPATPPVGLVIWQGFLDGLNFAGFKGVRDKSCLPFTCGHHMEDSGNFKFGQEAA